MSGPKYVTFSFDATPEERMEIQAGLSNIRGVSLGFGNSVRIEDYSGYSVSEIRRIVADAKERVRVRNEQRRQELLRQAKEAEHRRIKRAIDELHRQGQQEKQRIADNVQKCKSEAERLRRLRAGGGSLPAVTPKGMMGDIDRAIADMDKALADIDRTIASLIQALESYEGGIDSHSTMESLESAIRRAPSTRLDSLTGVNPSATLQEIERLRRAFTEFKSFIDKTDSTLGASPAMASLLSKVSSFMSKTTFNSVEDLVRAMTVIKDYHRQFASEMRAEENSRLIQYIAFLGAQIERVSGISTGGAIRGSGTNHSELIAKEEEQIQRIKDSFEKLNYIHPTKESERDFLLGAISRLEAQPADEGTLRGITQCRERLESLIAACDIDAVKYEEFRKLSERLDYLDETCIVSNLKPPRVVSFDIEYADDSIEQARRAIAEAEHTIAISARDGRAAKLYATLTNRANTTEDSTAGSYELLTDEEISGERRRMRFTKEDALGVIFEYVIEPGGNLIRRVRGVSVSGQELIGREALIERMNTDCDDMRALAQDMHAMGEEMRFTEMQTASEYAEDEDCYLELSDTHLMEYVRKSLREEYRDMADSAISAALSGATTEEIYSALDSTRTQSGAEAGGYLTAD